MTQRYFTDPYQFVPPYRGRRWCRLIGGTVTARLRKRYQVQRCEYVGLEHLQASRARGAGILLTPNHSRMADAAVVAQLSRDLGYFVYILISYHLFRQGRVQRWLLNRVGCYSILREGADHEAIRASAEVLTQAERPLLVFPEGTWCRQNDRLGSLQEGVALIARKAARAGERPVVVHPMAIKYWALQDPRPVLKQRLARLEQALAWQPQDHIEPLPRLEKLYEALLALKEIEHFGAPRTGSVDERIRQLAEAHVSRSEMEQWGQTHDGPLIDRLRRLRHPLIRQLPHLATQAEKSAKVHRALDDLLFCENLNGHSLEYLHERPCAERLIEAVERIEETVFDRDDLAVVPLGAMVEIGPALDVSDYPRGKPGQRQGGDPLMEAVAATVQGMLDRQLQQGPPPAWGCPAPFPPAPCCRPT